MSRIHLLTGLLALSLVVGCKAQSVASSAPDAALNRRIEVLVRSQFGIPPDVSVSLGQRKPSQISGYDSLPITLAHGASKKEIGFLISSDNSKLARLETFDLAKDPVFNIDVAGRPNRGKTNAKVTVIKIDDLQFPNFAPIQ